MKIYNYMEEIVKDALEGILSNRKDICQCQRCKLDMIAWALNRLPPKYVVSDKGRFYTKLQEVEIQFRTDVVRELAKAIAHITEKPLH